MEKDTKKYEIGFLVRSEEDATEIKALLSSQKAEVISEGRMRKLKFAYPIKKEVSGFFGYTWFMADPSAIKGLSEKLKLSQKVLRSIIIALEDKAEETKEGEKKAEKSPSKSREHSAEKGKKENADMVDNELLEKKLEEILK